MKDKTEKTYTVYTITYQGRVMYVGKTCDFKNRVYKHRCRRGANNRSSAIPVDADINYVEIIPIEKFDNEVDALKREDKLICEYDTINNGWNRQRSGLIKVSDTKSYQRELEKTEKRKAYQREYQKTEKRKAYRQKLEKTEKRKAYQREWQRDYRQTPEYKAYQREYNRQYYQRKKAEKLAS